MTKKNNILKLLCSIPFYTSLAASEELVAQNDWRVVTSVKHFEGYDHVSRKAFSERFQDFEQSGRNLRYLADSAFSIKAERNRFQLETFLSQQIFIKASPDTGSLYALIQQGQPAQTGKNYNIKLDGIAIRRRGVSLGYDFSRYLKSAEVIKQLNVSLSGYEIADFRRVQVRGDALALGDDSYRFNASGLDANTRAQFEFPQRQGTFQGQGAGVNFSVVSQIGERGTLQVNVQDLLTFNSAKNLPFVSSDLTSEVRERNTEGQLSVRPAVVQQNSYISERFSLKRRAQVVYESPFGNSDQYSWNAGVQTYGSFTMPVVALFCNTCLKNGWQLGVESNLYYRTIGPTLRHDRFTAYLQTDSLSASDRRALAAGMAINQPF